MSVNKVILVGRLGRDPEVRYMPSGDPIATFSIATDEQWKDKNGERQTRTEWHNITLFGKLGEISGQYLKKGSLVFIEGKIQSRKYTDKAGVERTAYNIVGNEMKMLGGRGDALENSASFDDNGPNKEISRYTTPPVTVNNSSADQIPETPRRQPSSPTPPVDDLDDDIPF